MNVNKQQQSTAKQMRKPRPHSRKRKQTETNENNFEEHLKKEAGVTKNEYATRAKQTEAHDNVPEQNGNWKRPAEANVTKRKPMEHKSNIHFKSEWKRNHNHNL